MQPGLAATGTRVPYGIAQCYLPPGRADITTLTPSEAGTRFSDPAVILYHIISEIYSTPITKRTLTIGVCVCVCVYLCMCVIACLSLYSCRYIFRLRDE